MGAGWPVWLQSRARELNKTILHPKQVTERSEVACPIGAKRLLVVGESGVNKQLREDFVN